MATNSNKKQQSLDKYFCKYGPDCYQKNTEHRKRFRHPSPKPGKETDDTKLGISPKKSPKKAIEDTDIKQFAVALNSSGETESSSEEIEIRPSPTSPVNVKDNIKEKFLMDMPTDFYDLYDFCQTIKKKDPSEAFSELGLHLVGPYDVLSKKITNKDLTSSDDIFCHWRYYYDPPEFQTVIKKDGEDYYHIGYFRDDPKEMPFGLASNSVSLGPKMKIVGDNIFCAISSEIQSCIKKLKTKLAKEKYKKIHADLVKFAENKNYSLEVSTPQTKKRNKDVVAKTFHGLGIVVPYDKKRQLGYRCLPEDDATLKAILNKISKCEEESAKLIAREPLDLILTNLQFANDECDYGMGLELGIDLFCFGDSYLHSDVKFVLTLAYELLGRPEYSRILEAHLKNRRKGDQLSMKKTVK